MNKRIIIRSWVILIGLMEISDVSFSQQRKSSNGIARWQWKFDLGTDMVAKGYTPVLPADAYSKERGYGIVSEVPVKGVVHKGKNPLTSDFITSDKPFYFQVDLPEGNYKVKITFGDLQGKIRTTVKAESRRLMLEKVETQPGEIVTKEFTVNVRSARINQKDSIRLKPREKVYLNWDNKLTLEFNNAIPSVSSIEITRVENAINMFLAGNSTVVDQEEEPWAAWGQMMPAFFKSDVVVANYAESGESLKSFEAAKRFEKILSIMKKGDYLFIEFAHNDQKPGPNHVDAFTTYKEALKHFIQKARELGGIPVLVTSMHRRKFDEVGSIVNTLEDYPEAVRQTGAEEKVPVIDLNAMSKVLYEALGVEESKKAFVHYPVNTFPKQTRELADNTHFNNYGAYQLAKCIVEEIRINVPDLAKYLNEGLPSFDPQKPDKPDEWNFPLSPSTGFLKPDGN